MSYTVSEAVTQIRSLINESSGSFWTDTEIENWIKEATIDISTKLLSAESEDTVTLVTNQWIYTSSDESWIANLIRAKACYFTDASGHVYGMQRIEPHQIGHNQAKQTAGRPKYYFNMNRKFYIWPKPSATESNYDITVLNSYETDDMTTLRDEHQPLIFMYAAAKCKQKDRMFQDASLLLGQYLNAVSFERQDKYLIKQDPTTAFKLR